MSTSYRSIRSSGGSGGIPAVLYGEPAEKLFFYVHGRHSRKEEAEGFAEDVVPLGYQVLAFDLPEHGERKGENYPCTVQNGVYDLRTVYEALKGSFRSVSLFACSLGAYFSLVAYSDVAFEKCLLLSPVLDMERLIRNMMRWANVDEAQLRREREIPTPFGETLSWDYYEYVRARPVDRWSSPTSILYGENDNLTERCVLDAFARKFACRVTVMSGGEHYFRTAEQLAFLKNWIREEQRRRIARPHGKEPRCSSTEARR